MPSRLAQNIIAGMGVAALMTAAFSQAATTPQHSTVQPGIHATAYDTKPITFGLVPAPKPKPAPTVQNDATTLYDYINPCSLIPLDAIRKITGNNKLKFDSKNGGMTTNVADAQALTINGSGLPRVCALGTDPNSVKLPLFLGIKTQQSAKDFGALLSDWGSSSYRLQSVGTFGLPSAREATAVYAPVAGRRLFWMLFVRTNYNQVLVVKWSGSSTQPSLPALQQLAYEALRTLTGSRYPGK